MDPRLRFTTIGAQPLDGARDEGLQIFIEDPSQGTALLLDVGTEWPPQGAQLGRAASGEVWRRKATLARGHVLGYACGRGLCRSLRWGGLLALSSDLC